jgi:hypothetical protein
MIAPLINHLQQFAKLKDTVEVERFDATLNQIASLDDPQSINLLIPFFDDNTKFPEAMFSIIHTIERFDDNTYIHGILESLPKFWRDAPYWASVIHFRIFNSPSALQAYREQLRKAETMIQNAARELLLHIINIEPKFSKTSREILANLN